MEMDLKNQFKTVNFQSKKQKEEEEEVYTKVAFAGVGLGGLAVTALLVVV